MSVGRHKVVGQISLELIIISDTLHAPDDQSLPKDVILQRHGDEGRKYLRPGVEILHNLSRGESILEALVLLGYLNFSLGRFSAQLSTKENSCACLFSGFGFKRMGNPIVLYLSTMICMRQVVRGLNPRDVPEMIEPATRPLSQG